MSTIEKNLMKCPTKSELMHLQLQAAIKEYNLKDIKYIGIHNNEHYYDIKGNEVPVSMILSLDPVSDSEITI